MEKSLIACFDFVYGRIRRVSDGENIYWYVLSNRTKLFSFVAKGECLHREMPIDNMVYPIAVQK